MSDSLDTRHQIMANGLTFDFSLEASVMVVWRADGMFSVDVLF